MALGSTPRQLKPRVIHNGIKTVVFGLLIGMVGAASVASALRSLLYGVVPLDPVVMSSVAALLLTVAFMANYFPARRAARIDPLEALRQD